MTDEDLFEEFDRLMKEIGLTPEMLEDFKRLAELSRDIAEVMTPPPTKTITTTGTDPREIEWMTQDFD